MHQMLAGRERVKVRANQIIKSTHLQGAQRKVQTNEALQGRTVRQESKRGGNMVLKRKTQKIYVQAPLGPLRYCANLGTYSSWNCIDSYSSTPNGAFHWWDIGADGHVAMAMPSGWAMMASCHIQESWGNCIGSASVSDCE